MNIQKILFPTDLSELSLTAFDYAVALARNAKAELLIVRVMRPEDLEPFRETPFYGQADPKTILEPQLRRIVPGDGSVPCRHFVLMGDPAAAIDQLARHERVDVIVMATRGRTGLRRAVMGSVAEDVARNAPCPVLSVTAKHDEPADLLTATTNRTEGEYHT